VSGLLQAASVVLGIATAGFAVMALAEGWRAVQIGATM
jgi:hypothetical protein